MSQATWLKRNWGVSVACLLVLLLGVAFVLGFRPTVETARCPLGLISLGPRCCANGQKLIGGACVGHPRSCPHGFTSRPPGCVVDPKKIRIPAGKLSSGPADWQSPTPAPRTVPIESFDLDAFEVTVGAWRDCVGAGRCAPLGSRTLAREPGQPVTEVTPEQAESYCQRWGGRLPTVSEWMWAAAGEDERRFPWGPTGLVCRRASFGLVAGPCAEGGQQPELSGARPDGRTPEGVADLAGNVAEWARSQTGHYRALGGSFESQVAGELSANAAFDAAAPARHIGFRCIYPASQP